MPRISPRPNPLSRARSFPARSERMFLVFYFAYRADDELQPRRFLLGDTKTSASNDNNYGDECSSQLTS